MKETPRGCPAGLWLTTLATRSTTAESWRQSALDHAAGYLVLCDRLTRTVPLESCPFVRRPARRSSSLAAPGSPRTFACVVTRLAWRRLENRRDASPLFEHAAARTALQQSL